MCTPNKTHVNWHIDKKLTEKIKEHLLKDKFEMAGKILFKDINCESRDICNKTSTDFKINKGSKNSVLTPDGIINFHTHPKSCYDDEKVEYGWPSGEDMAQIINFANRGNLIHIVFTLEGAYLVKVKNIPEKKDINRIENFFKKTHGFRGKNLSLQLSNFKKFLTGVVSDKKGDSVDLWLKMTNNITLEKIYKFENKKNTDKRKIFEVKLLNFNNGMNFKGNYISETCHKKYFTR